MPAPVTWFWRFARGGLPLLLALLVGLIGAVVPEHHHDSSACDHAALVHDHGDHPDDQPCQAGDCHTHTPAALLPDGPRADSSASLAALVRQIGDDAPPEGPCEAPDPPPARS